jgi:hypothetical protein
MAIMTKQKTKMIDNSLAEIYKEKAEYAEDDYLRKNGWEYTSTTPGSIWTRYENPMRSLQRLG